jgi:hypothetical protein
MSVHNLPNQLSSATLDTKTGTERGFLFDQTLNGYILGAGTTVPSDAATGWAKGCLYIHTDGAGLDTSLYINVGSGTSANFDAMTA